MEYRPSFLKPMLNFPSEKIEGEALVLQPGDGFFSGPLNSVALSNCPASTLIGDDSGATAGIGIGFMKRAYTDAIIMPGTVTVHLFNAAATEIITLRDNGFGRFAITYDPGGLGVGDNYTLINYVSGLILVADTAWGITTGFTATVDYRFFQGGSGWLRNGVVIPGAILRSELDYLVKALNSIAYTLPGGSETASENLQFQAGRQVNYAEPNTYNREQVLALSSGSDQLAVDLDALSKSDTAFNTITLDPASQAYGCRAMRLGLTFSATLSAGSIRHPSHASRTAASEFVIRDSGDRADVGSVPKESVGEHVLAVGDTVDTTSAMLATFTDMIEVDLRNFNNSFKIRVGTGLTFGASSVMGVKILEVLH